MKIIYNRFIPWPGYLAINLFGVLFVREEYRGKVNQVIINHEAIHTAQMKELGWIGFYLLYLIEYLIIKLSLVHLMNQREQYRDISFEQEARENEKNLDYLKTRRHYAWTKHLSIKKSN